MGTDMKQRKIRRYMTIDEIQKEYLPISKKRIRNLVKRYLSVKMIGNRMFVDRDDLEKLLDSQNSDKLDLNP